MTRRSQKPANPAIRGGLPRWLAPAFLTLFLVAGCGGSGKSGDGTTSVTLTRETTTSTTTRAPRLSKHELAQEYQRIAKPLSKVGNTFVSKAVKWTKQTTNEEAARDAAPLIAAYREADRELLRINWPQPMDRHVKLLVRANDLLIADLVSLRTINLRASSSWQSKFVRDASRAATVVDIVRADLDLPATR
ncbi:MAG TPA: hypothetical protein VFM43_07865 [Gaiellaceae bacterium]|nr:hypothetical protein [Gaiellaceae bacterium]